MKHRFETGKQPSLLRNLILSAGLFFLISGIFLYGVTAVSQKSSALEERTLQQAVRRDIVRCYALEGRYPESLEYLKENYGLHYNEDRFFIDYHAIGSNLMPDVTIIDRRAAS